MTNDERAKWLAYQLGLNEWRVSIGPDVKPEVYAETEVNEQERSAVISLGTEWLVKRVDMDNRRRDEVLIHELGHALIADMTWTVEELMLKKVKGDSKDLALAAWDQEVEKFCDRLGRALATILARQP